MSITLLYKNLPCDRQTFMKKYEGQLPYFDLKTHNFFYFLGSLTRNSSTDLTDFKSRNEKRKVYNALAAASIFKNSAGVDTSRRQVVPMDAFLHFLSHFQKEHLSEEEASQLIEV